MLILGIDPGTATTGYGLIEMINGKVKAITWGLIESDKECTPSSRLLTIYEQVYKIFKETKPDVIAMEKLFFANNAKTAIRVGQAQGIYLLVAAKIKKEVIEYAPGTIKKVIGGNGRADKKVIQQHLRKFLGNQIKSKAHQRTHFDNAADALAVALCHAISLDTNCAKML